jgi:hypothetical protein
MEVWACLEEALLAGSFLDWRTAASLIVIKTMQRI